MLVNWDDYSQYMGKYKMFQTTNQKCVCVGLPKLFKQWSPKNLEMQFENSTRRGFKASNEWIGIGKLLVMKLAGKLL